MSDPDRLLDEFKADYEAGRPVDVLATLDEVDPGRRQELAEMIDLYLMDAPRRRWDPAAYEGSMAQAAVERVYESIEGVSGAWPELLPRLRAQARIKRSELVRRLAAALGFDEQPQVDKIAGYYNGMEHGLLPAAGVSERVLAALAEIVGTSAETIRGAGARGGGDDGPAAAFARTAFDAAEFAEPRTIEMDDADGATVAGAGRDEIDALFLDG